MHIYNINNNQQSPKFEALKVRKLTSNEIGQIKVINEAYDEIFQKLSKYNFPSRLKFKKPFPGLYDKDITSGLLLHVGNNLAEKIHLHRFGEKASVKMDVLDNKKNSLINCTFSGDEITIKTSDKYDANPRNNTEKTVADLFKNAITEIKLLLDYTRAFNKIRKILPQKNTKEDIINIIAEAQKEIEPTLYANSDDIKGLLATYNDFNEVLNYRRGNFTVLFKELYFKDKYCFKEKGIAFETPDGGKINFLPLDTDDNRTFRIYKYDKNNKLEQGLFGYADGTMSKIKNLKKQIIPVNFVKISDEEVKEFDVPKMVEFLCTEMNKFRDFILSIIDTHKLVKSHTGNNRAVLKEEYVRPYTANPKTVKLRADKKAKKLEKIEKLKQEKKAERVQRKAIREEKKLAAKAEIKLKKQAEREKIKAEKLANREAIELEKKRIKEQKQAEKLEKIKQKQLEREKLANLRIEKRKQREALKKLGMRIKPVAKPNKVVSTKASEVSSELPKVYKEVPLADIIYDIETVFQTPIEKRHPRYSHVKMKDGKIFAGQFSIKADDGTKITVKKVKSPRYVEFTYYSISAEKDNLKSVINIDPERNRIIYSDENGRPFVINNTIKYLSREQACKNTHCPESWDGYFYQLFNSNAKDGKIEKSELKMAPKKKPSIEKDLEMSAEDFHLASLYKFDL